MRLAMFLCVYCPFEFFFCDFLVYYLHLFFYWYAHSFIICPTYVCSMPTYIKQLLWAEVRPPKIHIELNMVRVEAQIPNTSENDCIWR